VHQQMIMKSGGNAFHGSIEGDYENENWQSNNVSDELAAKGFSWPPVGLQVCGFPAKMSLWMFPGASIADQVYTRAACCDGDT